MQWNSLRVMHQAGAEPSGADSPGETADGVLRLSTCQRRIWAWLDGLAAPPTPHSSAQYLHGQEAYRFLLEVACGLRSRMRGETEIMAQLKAALGAFSARHGHGHAMAVLGTALLADAKEVRSEHLRGVGDASYPRAVARLMPAPLRKVVVMGAGALAAGMLGHLHATTRVLWNRTTDTARALTLKPFGRGWTVAESLVQLEDEVAGADLVVVCVPPEGERDGRLLAGFRRGGELDRRRFIHLGCAREAAPRLAGPGALFLNEVWSVLEAERRAVEPMFAAARRACRDRAILRSIPGARGSHAHVAHGWEDLAAFQ